MSEFYYEAYLKNGDVVRDHISAANEGAAHRALSASGKIPFVLVPASASSETNDKPGAKRGMPFFKRNDISTLISDITVLLRSGFTIDQSIAVLVEERSGYNGQRMAAQLLELLREGKTVANAFSDLGASEETCALIAAGEASGKLVDVFEAISGSTEEQSKRNAEITEALLYPAFLVLVMLFSVGILTFYLVPAIEPIFAASGVANPSLIVVLGGIRGFLSGGGGLTLTCAIALLAISAILPGSRESLRNVMFGLPAVGRFLIEANIAKYLRTLSMLMENSVPAKDAMKLSSSTARTRNLRVQFHQAEQSVRSGSSMHAAFRETRLFGQGTVAQIRLGEEANSLPAMLLRCATSIEHRQKRRIDRAMTFLTPAITIGLGAMVGTLVISVMSALLSINEIVVQ